MRVRFIAPAKREVLDAIDYYNEQRPGLGIELAREILNGDSEVHDRMVNLPGAFAALCRAIERGREAGLECEGNLFLNKENIPQFEELISARNPIDPARWNWHIASYAPFPRLRQYEAIRPETCRPATICRGYPFLACITCLSG